MLQADAASTRPKTLTAIGVSPPYNDGKCVILEENQVNLSFGDLENHRQLQVTAKTCIFPTATVECT